MRSHEYEMRNILLEKMESPHCKTLKSILKMFSLRQCVYTIQYVGTSNKIGIQTSLTVLKTPHQQK